FDYVIDLLPPRRADAELILLLGDLLLQLLNLARGQRRRLARKEAVYVGVVSVAQRLDHWKVALGHVTGHRPELTASEFLLLVALHPDVDEVAAGGAIMGRLVARGAEDRSWAERIQPHHHPTAELHLAMRKHAEHGLELVVVEGMHVVKHYER